VPWNDEQSAYQLGTEQPEDQFGYMAGTHDGYGDENEHDYVERIYPEAYNQNNDEDTGESTGNGSVTQANHEQVDVNHFTIGKAAATPKFECKKFKEPFKSNNQLHRHIQGCRITLDKVRISSTSATAVMVGHFCLCVMAHQLID